MATVQYALDSNRLKNVNDTGWNFFLTDMNRLIKRVVPPLSLYFNATARYWNPYMG